MTIFRKIFTETHHREQKQLAENPPHTGFDRKTAVILVWTALGLAITKYYGDTTFVSGVLKDWHLDSLDNSFRSWLDSNAHAKLHHLEWWVGSLIFVYFIVPVIFIRFVFREKLSDYGLKRRGAFHSWPIYVLMLAIMLPLIYYFSSTASFQRRYPFYDPVHGESLWPDFWIWELFYFSQFIALEFYFRGVMTLGLKHRFGYYSIFVMTIPYCMIHFGKPMPETIGAIFAGIILGTLSMKSRSVWLGVAIHYSIALSMDMFSLWRKGFF
ncbi:MAG TPA: CPBP family intramembrane glutamic endopeptidase [Bacteroidia bacterium]|nr:CPBP family intramembrane glutamic endopeptidase [Bacteroidia bacterium]